ncbi:TonB-dependent receptor family protein [Wenzhouxiangella sp. EGI_FJ10409]|uniref:TonB-dependent receptor family protein n=1 Tax=Wenzhouxiangella sp. EGI_FJ10409 TaxID=3243767 RepID=UPI0035D7EC01
MIRKYLFAALAIGLATGAAAQSEDNNREAASDRGQEEARAAQQTLQSILDRLRIVGSSADARRLSGTGAVIDPQQMEIEAQTDINQLLKTVPGVYIREEDGEGLRPNIGIRAAAGGRSSKVTLLEDGVMIAPAPYSNPAAYYFPQAFQMHAVEVLKGAPLLRHGPQTTGGVINLVTTPIPAETSGRILTMLGEHGRHDTHAWVGGREGDFGWLVDTVYRDSDGFKDIDRSNRDTGFDIESYILKFGWTGERQSLLAKAQYSEETSNETYAGLTDADFDRDPNRRYGLSEIDQMNNDHQGFSLAWDFDLSDRMALSALAYYNEFARDWFKGSFGSLVDAANAGDPEALGVLHGEVDIAGLGYKHNNREYESYGLELALDAEFGDHRLQLGARDHSDRMDRFQPVEVYDQINGSLVYRDVIAPTGGDNRLEGADAIALWAMDQWQVTPDLKLDLALRYEDAETFRRQFGSPDRADEPARRSSSASEWLPGASLTWDFANRQQLLAGVHRGFAPLGGGATENDEPETSVNYELGWRYFNEDLFVELVGFLSDFENQAEVCSNASPCSNGATSGTFVTGEAVVKGVEFQLANEWRTGGLTIPLSFNYTYSDAQISEDNPVTGVFDGDELADIPENIFSLRLGFEHSSGWDNHFIAKYMDETCIQVGCNRADGAFERTESLFVVDWISRYAITDEVTAFVKVDNLLDEQVIISRLPHGARPNKPRTGMVGVDYRF